MIDKPSFASIWLLSQLYRDRGDAASLDSLRGMLKGEPFAFSDLAWKSTGVKPPRLEGTVPFSAGKLKGSYSYDAGSGRVIVKLGAKLFDELNADLIKSLEPGDLQVLGVRSEPFIGTPRGSGPAMSSQLLVAEAETSWKSLLNTFDSAINRLVLELKDESGKVLTDPRPQAVGRLKVSGKLDSGELLEWSLRDGTGEQAKIIRGLSGKGPQVNLDWDTLYEADGDVDRYLHYRYKAAGGEVKSGSPLGVRIRVKNPDADVKLGVKQVPSFPDRKIEAVVTSNRPLESNSIVQLRHPALDGGQAVIQLGMPKLSGTGVARRWEYRGAYVLKAASSVQGSVDTEASFFLAGATKPEKRTGSVAISPSTAISLQVPVKTPPAPFVIVAAASAELPESGLEVLVRRSDGKSDVVKPSDTGDPRRRSFAVPIDENYPLGLYSATLRFEGRDLETHNFEVYQRVVWLREVRSLRSSVLRPGEPGEIEFRVEGVLKEDLEATVFLDGKPLATKRCKRGLIDGAWRLEVTPEKAGKLTFDFGRAASLEGKALLVDPKALRELECRNGGPRFLLAQSLQSGKLGVGSHALSIEQEAGLPEPVVRLIRTPEGGQAEAPVVLPVTRQMDRYVVNVDVKRDENALLALVAESNGLKSSLDLLADGTPPEIKVSNTPPEGDAGKAISLTIRVAGGIAPGSRPQVVLAVNGRRVQSASRGTDDADRFESSIDLFPEGGEGQIIVTAQDEAGNVATLPIPIKIVGKAAVVTPEKRFAIIVGFQNYGAESNLDGAHDSAAKLADTLLKSGYRSDRVFVILDARPRENLKFAVAPGVAATAQELKELIKSITGRMRAAQMSHGVFAYIGHGAWMRANQHLLAPDFRGGQAYAGGTGEDVEAATAAGCLSVQNVVDLICPQAEENSIQTVLMIIDACKDQRWTTAAPLGPRVQIRGASAARAFVFSSVDARGSAAMITHPAAGFRGAVFTEMLCRMLSAGGVQGTWLHVRQVFAEKLKDLLDDLRSRIPGGVPSQNPNIDSNPTAAQATASAREFFDPAPVGAPAAVGTGSR